ncbi:DDE Tnp4 domain-containing protein [Citrus sinensis]|nr:DDE Tnp4 domain-containing protein [Citrus sinensis]
MIRSRAFQFHATRLQYLDSIIGNSDIQCVNQLRMDRRTFGLLCELLRSRGLKASRLLAIEEQVCMFLHTLSHHVKNRTIDSRFFRSGETVSRYFNSVLNEVLWLHNVLLRVPDPVPENCTDERWKWFKNCLGALDGTYIRVRVSENYKPRYRTRKGEIATNVLGVCSRDMKFIFVMSGWEGSASDSRVLRDALNKPTSLKVPAGMESGGPSHTTGNKTGLRRAWTKDKEEAMLNILDAVVANGGRADNDTFKSRSYKYIENELEKLLPGSGLKVYPHIDSKIRIWRKSYGVIFDMLNTSGFGWNEARKCVVVDSDEVWRSYMESHKDASNWRDKPFPYYERLANIFGKVRATGSSAETPNDMANAALQEEINDDDNEIDDEGSPMSTTLPSNSQYTTRSRSQSSNKRSEDHDYIGRELASMGLSVDDELIVLNLMVEKPSHIRAFKVLRNDRDRKLAYVRMLLREHERRGGI